MGSYRKGAVFNPKDTSANRFMGRGVIYGADGEHETPYMTRFWFGSIRFHIFYRGDQDPDCHDHPWDFWTFPLRSYVEEVLEERIEKNWGTGKTRTYYLRHVQIVKAFRLHYRPAKHKHRVLGKFTGWIYPIGASKKPKYAVVGTVPTIVFRSGVKRKWGFTKLDSGGKWCWIPWKKYVYEGGKHAPCEDE